MKFKIGDKVRRSRMFYDKFPESTQGVVSTVIGFSRDGQMLKLNHTQQNWDPQYFELAVLVFDRYLVRKEGNLVAIYETFEEADTRARGLAEGGHIVTVVGVTKDQLIATYQRPNNPVEVIFADQT